MSFHSDNFQKKKKLSINDIKQLSRKALPLEYQQAPWSTLRQRGKDIIQEGIALDGYFVAFASQHSEKIKIALKELPTAAYDGKLYIFDWGCGQGIATLTLLSYLKEHCCLNNITQINLIDPSSMAVDRAKTYVSSWVGTEKVNVFSCFFDELETFKLDQDSTAVHLFSNILDVESINTYDLAHRIARMNVKNQYLLIASPNYLNGNKNIESFINFFDNFELNKTKQEKYRTSQVNYTYYIRALKLQSNLHSRLQPITQLKAHNYFLSILAKACTKLNSTIPLHSQYEYYSKPFFPGCTPDMLVMKRGSGMSLIRICDIQIDDFQVECEALKNQKFYLFKQYETSGLPCTSPTSISQVLYLHNCTSKNDLIAEEKYSKNQHTTLIDMDELSEDTLCQILRKTFSKKEPESLFFYFSNSYPSNFKAIKNKVDLLPTKRQAQLIESKPSSEVKIKGFAGSGKTFLLCHRAVNAHKRTEDNVLILTYNITLRNYIRERLSQVDENLNWQSFHISNYHEFIKAHRHIPSGGSAWFDDASENPFENYRNELPKYSAIFIDEVQDYSYTWLQVIKKYFATEDAEIVIFADEKQRIYDRNELSIDKMPSTPIKGRWTQLKTDSKYCRLSPSLVRFAEEFQNYFFKELYNIDSTVSVQLLFNDSLIKYCYIEQIELSSLALYINHLIKQEKLIPEDTAILTFQKEKLQYIENSLRETFRRNTNLLSLSKEEIQKTSNKHKGEKENLERNKKLNFSIKKGHFTLSTIHSFKGWEAKNLFLILYDSAIKHPKGQDELIYTAITRGKKNLFIINVGSQRYHHFFVNSKYIQKL